MMKVNESQKPVGLAGISVQLITVTMPTLKKLESQKPVGLAGISVKPQINGGNR